MRYRRSERPGEAADPRRRIVFVHSAPSNGSTIGSMKSKTSITLSATLMEELDRIVGENGSRSDLIEKAVREYLQRIAREERDQRDLQILNRSAKRMGREAKEVLRYQVKL